MSVESILPLALILLFLMGMFISLHRFYSYRRQQKLDEQKDMEALSGLENVEE